MSDVSRADGTSATNGLSGQIEWSQRRTGEIFTFKDTLIYGGYKSGGLGGRIGDGLALRHIFRSRDRDNVEDGTVVDDPQGLCDNRRFSVGRSVVVQQRWNLG